MTITLIVAGIVYGLSVLFIGTFLMIPFAMMSGDSIPSKNWIWWFFIPTILTWPLAPLWIRLIEWLDYRLMSQRKR